jgi:hypothetical protein
MSVNTFQQHLLIFQMIQQPPYSDDSKIHLQILLHIHTRTLSSSIDFAMNYKNLRFY